MFNFLLGVVGNLVASGVGTLVAIAHTRRKEKLRCTRRKILFDELMSSVTQKGADKDLIQILMLGVLMDVVSDEFFYFELFDQGAI